MQKSRQVDHVSYLKCEFSFIKFTLILHCIEQLQHTQIIWPLVLRCSSGFEEGTKATCSIFVLSINFFLGKMFAQCLRMINIMS